MDLRKHQKELLTIIDEIIHGSSIYKIIVHATPGSGKSALPIIAGKLIHSGHAAALCWICPRKSLQDQGERNFLDPRFREFTENSLTIRSSTNEYNPCRDQNGFITTYQAISMDDERTVLTDFCKKPYILVLDEFHHVADDGIWFQSIKPLVNQARYVILMTGTLERGDNRPIAWIDYAPDCTGLKPSLPPWTILYSRTDALKDKAILPIRFFLSDGQVEWESKTGRHRAGKLSEMGEFDSSSALFTALNTEFADTLLDEGLRSWQWYKQGHPRSKLMVVTSDYNHAKKFTKTLKDKGLYAKIATSHESPQALRNIKEYKFGDLDILVTIAMAYEGLDVPSMTHIVCLTQIRSRPWIEQMVARAVRVDPDAGPYESQAAFVFAPDDPLFREIVELIRSEQISLAAPQSDGEGKGGGAGDGEEGRRNPCTPLGGNITGTREIHLGEIPDGGSSAPYVKTVRELEEEALSKIENYVRAFTYRNRYHHGRINAEIKAYWGQHRRDMGLTRLKEVLKWVQYHYPLNGSSPPYLPERMSKSRAKRDRVSPKAEKWTPIERSLQ